MAHLLGVFSFVNALWCIATLGVTVSVGPALAVVFGPVVARLAAVVQPLLRAAAQALLRILTVLKPVYEVLAYAICLYIIGASLGVGSCTLTLPLLCFLVRAPFLRRGGAVSDGLGGSFLQVQLSAIRPTMPHSSPSPGARSRCQPSTTPAPSTASDMAGRPV